MFRHLGFVYFVPFTAPGDLIRARIVQLSKSYGRAHLDSLLEPSPDRVMPRCPVYGICGGCQWQHLSSEAQLRAKTDLVRSHLQKHLKIDPSLVLATLPSPVIWHYRNRIQVRVRDSKIGFFARGSNDLVPTTECVIAAEPLQDEMNKLRRGLQGKQGKVELTLTESGVRADWNQPHGKTVGFSQVNSAANEVLRRLVADWVVEIGPRYLVELYCGAGNLLTACARALGPTVPAVGVENHPAAALRFRESVRAQNLPWVSLVEAPAEKARLQVNMAETAILVDPPRVGMSTAVVEQLNANRPRTILYVSCNPTTFTRDLQRLKGFQLVRVQPVDMFPQTSHVELVALLQRG